MILIIINPIIVKISFQPFLDHTFLVNVCCTLILVLFILLVIFELLNQFVFFIFYLFHLTDFETVIIRTQISTFNFLCILGTVPVSVDVLFFLIIADY